MCYLAKFTTISGLWEDSLTFIQRVTRRHASVERLQLFQVRDGVGIYRPINVAERDKVVSLVYKHYHYKDVSDD